MGERRQAADNDAGDRDFGVSDAGFWDDGDSREERYGDPWD